MFDEVHYFLYFFLEDVYHRKVDETTAAVDKPVTELPDEMPL